MNILGFVSVIILLITILTLIFGIIAYFLYKARERKSNKRTIKTSYEETLKEMKSEYVYFN